MKKVLSFLTAVSMLLSVFSLTAFAEEYNGIRYAVRSEQEKTCAIVEYDGYDTVLNIPAVLGGYTVTSIEREAFSNGDKLERVVIPATVTYIGRYAFYYCVNLESVTIPNGVTYIDDHAFENCPLLSCVVIPSSVQTIEAEAFGYFNRYDALEKIRNFTVIGTKGSAAEAYAEENGFRFVQLGDVHTDSNVTAVDARWVLQAAAGLRALQFDSWRIADVNQDGVINSVDARWVLQTAAGMRTF